MNVGDDGDSKGFFHLFKDAVLTVEKVVGVEGGEVS